MSDLFDRINEETHRIWRETGARPQAFSTSYNTRNLLRYESTKRYELVAYNEFAIDFLNTRNTDSYMGIPIHYDLNAPDDICFLDVYGRPISVLKVTP